MATTACRENDTMSLGRINAVLPLISLMSAHFLVNSFTLVSDLQTTSVKDFRKMASKHFLGMNHRNSIRAGDFEGHDDAGLIVLERSAAEVSQMMNLKARLMVAVYNERQNDSEPAEFLSGIIFPLSVPFFVVLLSEDSGSGRSADTSRDVTGKCFRLYRPVPSVPLKMFPVMSYDGREGPKWFWEHEENFFRKETRDMRGVNVTIALATHLDKNLSIKRFWENKNSFFWQALEEHLGFRSRVHFQPLTVQTLKSITNVYILLLKTVADGLAVLPVISPERDHHVEFILTGCDSKYHLMVKTPEYVYSWQSIFKPLAFESWMCMGATILLISLALRVVTHRQNSHSSRKFDLSTCFLVIFGFLCFQSSTIAPRNFSVRLVYYTGLSFSLIMYQFYTSNLYSLLSTKEVKLPFTSLRQFMAKGTHSMYIHPDTALYSQIVKAKDGILKKLWDEFLKKDPSHQLVITTRRMILNKVCKGKGAIFGLPFQTIHFRELQCKLVPVNSGYFPTNVVTVVRKNFPFKSQFQFVHWRLLEAGVSHKFRDEFLNFESQYETKSVANEPVSMEHVAFPFGFLAAFLVLSLLVLAVEISVSKTTRTKKSRRFAVNLHSSTFSRLRAK